MNPGIDRTSYKPLYLQISEFLREEIKNGSYHAGDILPSEKKLMDDFHVSRNTSQKAIEDLVRDGLAIRIQGKGTFVPKSIVDFGLHRLTSFSEEMHFKGLKPSSKLISLNCSTVEKDITAQLNLMPDEPVYVLERVRYGDGNPMAYQSSYIPEKFCEGLDSHDFSKGSLFSVLEKVYHHRISWQEQQVKPRLARQKEAALLEVEEGTPLLYLEGVAYLERDIPIEYKRIYYRSDLYNFSLRSVRN